MNAPMMDVAAIDLDELRPKIKQVVQNYPDLSADGWKHFTFDYRQDNFGRARTKMLVEDFYKQVLTAWYFIQCTYPEDFDSYALKHAAERFGRAEGHASYVSNGALIVAAILRGYTPVREPNSLNCKFKKNGKFDKPRKA